MTAPLLSGAAAHGGAAHGAPAPGHTRERLDIGGRAAHVYGLYERTHDAGTLAVLESEIDALTRDVAEVHGPGHALQPMLEEWRVQARACVRAGLAREGVAFINAMPRGVDRGAPASQGWKGYLGLHGRSFAFASAFMPPEDRARIAGIYAWCRYTDDLVDVHAAVDPAERLDAWLESSRTAYHGNITGVELLDAVMPGVREAGVPFTYPAELVAGMRMDLRHRHFETMAELRLYTWRAAGTVGLWLAEMYGVRDAWALERAALLGQAMQMTNIIRDVGEDLDRGRLYLPLDRLAAHGLEAADLMAARRDGVALGDRWRDLLEELMAETERDYANAREALGALPAGFRRAAAVASHVYAGIHEAVRRIGYDTLRRRAATSAPEKLMLALRALRTA